MNNLKWVEILQTHIIVFYFIHRLTRRILLLGKSLCIAMKAQASVTMCGVSWVTMLQVFA